METGESNVPGRLEMGLLDLQNCFYAYKKNEKPDLLCFGP